MKPKLHCGCLLQRWVAGSPSALHGPGSRVCIRSNSILKVGRNRLSKVRLHFHLLARSKCRDELLHHSNQAYIPQNWGWRCRVNLCVPSDVTIIIVMHWSSAMQTLNARPMEKDNLSVAWLCQDEVEGEEDFAITNSPTALSCLISSFASALCAISHPWCNATREAILAQTVIWLSSTADAPEKAANQRSRIIW